MIESPYQPSPDRYDDGMIYRRAGRSGVLLPAFSLGMWHNFGSGQAFSNVQRMAHYAFDRGITHFDLANNYGPAYGTAEENFGRLMERSFRPYRDEMFIATKAGYDMWPGPYGNWGSRKYLTASLDQSLRRMKLDSSTSSIPTATTPRRPLRRPSRHWSTSSAGARRSTSDCRATRSKRRVSPSATSPNATFRACFFRTGTISSAASPKLRACCRFPPRRVRASSPFRRWRRDC